jgi:hypothetical protein
MNSLQKLLDFLDRLNHHHIFFTLARCRSEAVMVLVDVPGERWEIEFFVDSRVEVEVFRVDGYMRGEEELERLFAENSD